MPTFLFLKLQERKHSKAYLYSSSFNLSKSRDNFHVLNQCYRQYSSSIFVQGTFLESSYVDAKPLYEAQPFNAKSFGCGSFHIALISKDNLLYLFGENRKGQCGIDPEKNKNIESPICPVQNIPFERVYCGRDSTYAIPMTNNRIVYACGFNDKRQLGLGINESILYKMTPLKEFEAPIRDIRTSAGACWFLLENGKILNCGGNNFNELGTNDFCIQSVPLEPKFLVDFIGEKISDVRSGLSHSAVLTESGKLYTFGRGMEGQLGRAVQQSSKPLFIMDGIKKIRCGYEHTLVMDEMGKLYVFGVGISIPNIVWNWGSLPNKRTSQLDIDSALKLICEDAVDVETGPYHCLIKRANGKLYACGCLHNGRLMQTPTLQLIEIPGFENVDQIALGHYFSLFSDPKAPVPSRPVQKEEKLKSKKEDKEDNDDDDDDYW